MTDSTDTGYGDRRRCEAVFILRRNGRSVEEIAYVLRWKKANVERVLKHPEFFDLDAAA
jgi:hypothetical protein